MRNFFNQDQKTNSQNTRYQCFDPKDIPIVVYTQDWLKANLMNHWLKGIWPPCSRNYKPQDYFMWCEVEREVSKEPHNILASLQAKISEVMTNIEREIAILLCQRFWSQIEAVVEASGDFYQKISIKCVHKLFLKFSLKYIHPNYLF
jgi:hypothetical protein